MPNRSLTRPLAGVALFGGLALFAFSMLVLAALSADAGPTDIPALGPYVDSANATYLMPLPIGAYGGESLVSGTWSFPHDPGRLMVLSCADAANLTSGRAIASPVRVEAPARSGSVTLSTRDLFFHLHRQEFCGADTLALQWTAGSDPTANAPTVKFSVQRSPLNNGGTVILLAAASAGVVLTAVGGTLWTRLGRHAAAGARESAADGESTVETLRGLADHSVAWLERTRRYLLLGGVLGIFLWYPVLIAWAWTSGRAASGGIGFSVILVVVVLALLGVLTALWAREFVGLDRELRRWRERVERLRAREEEMMERFANH